MGIMVYSLLRRILYHQTVVVKTNAKLRLRKPSGASPVTIPRTVWFLRTLNPKQASCASLRCFDLNVTPAIRV